MPPSPQAAAHQEQAQQLASATALAVLAEWRQVDPDAVARSWTYLLDRVTAIVQAGQLTAARRSAEYMRTLLAEQSAPALVPAAFAGVAPDGRPLASLLALPIPATLGALAAGRSPAQALAHGGALLDMLARTVVADTGRQATQAAMVATPAVTSYVRVLELPSCARCIILAGREYGVSTGFLRHPRCDCVMEPVTREHRPTPIDARDVFDSLSPQARKRAFGEAGARAIEDGAGVAEVVNARKGMATITVHGRTVQATVTGTGRGRTRRPPRLMPEEIYRQAEDREHAARLLRINGYIR